MWRASAFCLLLLVQPALAEDEPRDVELVSVESCARGADPEDVAHRMAEESGRTVVEREYNGESIFLLLPPRRQTFAVSGLCARACKSDFLTTCATVVATCVEWHTSGAPVCSSIIALVTSGFRQSCGC